MTIDLDDIESRIKRTSENDYAWLLGTHGGAALVAEVERLRSINDDYLLEMGRQHAKLREQAHDAAKERAAVVAFLRRLFPENMTLTFMMDGVAADIERGDHLKENEK
jgi:hypothetical protein